MTKKSFTDTITADGVYEFPHIVGIRDYVVELSGSFGGGVATLGYVSRSGAFVAFPDPVTADTDLEVDGEKSFVIMLPKSGKFAVSLTGSTTPTLKFNADLN